MTPAGASAARRWAAVAALGVVTVACLLLGTGLGTGAGRGAGDNGDGARLYCGAGLTPDTVDGSAAWKGVVVTSFVATDQPCPSPLPTSALLPLRLAVAGQVGPWDLSSLATLYVALTTVGLLAAAAALARIRPRMVLLLLPIVVPLALPWFSRFFLSTYSEPTGLLGAVILLSGVVTVAAAADGPAWPRLAGLALTLLGGATAATAKPGYAVLALVALGVGALTRAPRSRLAGAAIAVAVTAAVAWPVGAALQWQQEAYGAVNTHNLVLTAVGPASGGDALAHLGLPASYRAYLGTAYFPSGPSAFEDWDGVVGEQWPRLRGEAVGYVLTHPATASSLADTGLRAATDPSLAYLPSGRADDPSARPTPIPTVPVGEQGADRPTLERWLGERSIVPSIVVLAAGVAQTVVVIRGRRRCGRAATALAAAGAAAVAGGALVVAAAVAGDGYFEIAKHVWLASYLGLVGLLAGVATAAACLLHRRGRPVPGREGDDAEDDSRSSVPVRPVPRR
ncbi:glycan biosynthesis hexose transferase WsfD [Actinomycetospora aeridis]|uniref:Integral membrane protein n=1 Tax=Actinomycetospora aeridis TaxID=3129231 RepID=A0ABU8N3T3_9PSEU